MAQTFNPSERETGATKQTAQEKLAELRAQESKIPTEETPQPKDQLHVKLISSFDTHFEGEAESFSATNTTGPFDVLPGHANFICLLLPGEVVINTSTNERVFTIGQGLLRVNDDEVTAFLNV